MSVEKQPAFNYINLLLISYELLLEQLLSLNASLVESMNTRLINGRI
jgi:hypothetical protein